MERLSFRLHYNLDYLIHSIFHHKDNILYYDDSNISGTNKTFYQYIKYLESISKKLGVISKTEILIKKDFDCYQFIEKSKASILYLQSINDNQYEKYVNTRQDDVEIIDINKLENQGQFILDIITYIAY